MRWPSEPEGWGIAEGIIWAEPMDWPLGQSIGPDYRPSEEPKAPSEPANTNELSRHGRSTVRPPRISLPPGRERSWGGRSEWKFRRTEEFERDISQNCEAILMKCRDFRRKSLCERPPTCPNRALHTCTHGSYYVGARGKMDFEQRFNKNFSTKWNINSKMNWNLNFKWDFIFKIEY